MSKQLLQYRLEHGWKLKDALQRPVRKWTRPQHPVVGQVTDTPPGWPKVTGASYGVSDG